MDSMDGATKLQKEFGVDWSEARKAIEAEAQDVRENGKRIKYGYSIEVATDRVAGWLKDADQYAVKMEWADLARFQSSHRSACVWGVLTGKAIQAAKEMGR